MKELKIFASSTYPVFVSDNLSDVTSVLPFIKGERVALLCDENIFGLYAKIIEEKFSVKKVYTITVKAGENSKNFDNYVLVIKMLLDSGFDREDTLITLGGGVVEDLGGFVASTFMRKINLIHFPTSLLSVVDSCIGGKNGINFEGKKNIVGTFYQPSAVFVYLDFLKTLPECEIKNGLGEIIKYSYISNKINFNELNNIDENLIYKCLSIKKKFVESDEFDNGIRKILNFGHTFGHAIERASEFTLPHGICVIKGILLALCVSKKYFNYGDGFINEYKKLAEKLELDLSINYPIDDLIESVNSDKKIKGEFIELCLIDENKKAKIIPVKKDKLRDYLL